MPLDVRIHGTAEEVWAFLWDADALARVLPGCESLRTEAPGRYAAVLRYPTPLLTVRADTEAELVDPVAPRSVMLVLDGRARGLGGTFHVEIPIVLSEEKGAEGTLTRVEYQVRVQATGTIASFGIGMLHDAIAGQVRGLAADIEDEIRAGRVPPMASA